jgi:hypothetical protein
MAEAHRAHWGRLIAATVVVLVGAFALPALVDAPDIQENRVLAKAPTPPTGLGGLTAYREAADAYVADHFPPRAHLIGALNALRLRLGVSGSTRVIVGHDGWLFSDNGSHLGAARGDPAMSNGQVAEWLNALAGRTEAMRAEGRTYVVLVPPVKEAVYPGNAPGWFELDFNRPAVTLDRLAAAAGAGEFVYPHAVIAQQARWGLHVYDRYDSHWTGLGAYHGYVAFMRALQQQGVAEGPRPLESFAELTDEPLANKPRDLALMLGVASFVHVDFPQFSDPAAAERLRITYLEGNRDWSGLRVIETGQVGKPVLLMTVDSFSNGLMPFLYGHFSRIITAHNESGVWRRDLIDRFQPDIVATEVLENGLGFVMKGSPPSSPAARARIVAAVALRQSHSIIPPTSVYRGKRRMLQGSEGPDRLKGSWRPDDIQGRPGDDTITGLGGDDVLRGGRGRDSVDAGAGNDWISGGRDDDILRGGKGADVFTTFEDAGTDQVLDFDPSEGDRVEVALGAAYTVRQAGADVVVDVRDARLILRGVQLIDLPSGWIRNK